MLFYTRAFEKNSTSSIRTFSRWLFAQSCLTFPAIGCGSTLSPMADFAPIAIALTAGATTQKVSITTTAINGSPLP